MKEKAQVANRRERESGIAPPGVAHISPDFVHDAPVFVKKALAMTFGVGSAKLIMAFDPGSAMAITALGFLNASVASLNSSSVSAKRLG